MGLASVGLQALTRQLRLHELNTATAALKAKIRAAAANGGSLASPVSIDSDFATFAFATNSNTELQPQLHLQLQHPHAPSCGGDSSIEITVDDSDLPVPDPGCSSIDPAASSCISAPPPSPANNPSAFNNKNHQPSLLDPHSSLPDEPPIVPLLSSPPAAKTKQSRVRPAPSTKSLAKQSSHQQESQNKQSRLPPTTISKNIETRAPASLSTNTNKNSTTSSAKSVTSINTIRSTGSRSDSNAQPVVKKVTKQKSPSNLSEKRDSNSKAPQKKLAALPPLVYSAKTSVPTQTTTIPANSKTPNPILEKKTTIATTPIAKIPEPANSNVTEYNSAISEQSTPSTTTSSIAAVPNLESKFVIPHITPSSAEISTMLMPPFHGVVTVPAVPPPPITSQPTQRQFVSSVGLASNLPNNSKKEFNESVSFGFKYHPRQKEQQNEQEQEEQQQQQQHQHIAQVLSDPLSAYFLTQPVLAPGYLHLQSQPNQTADSYHQAWVDPLTKQNSGLSFQHQQLLLSQPIQSSYYTKYPDIMYQQPIQPRLTNFVTANPQPGFTTPQNYVYHPPLHHLPLAHNSLQPLQQNLSSEYDNDQTHETSRIFHHVGTEVIIRPPSPPPLTPVIFTSHQPAFTNDFVQCTAAAADLTVMSQPQPRQPPGLSSNTLVPLDHELFRRLQTRRPWDENATTLSVSGQRNYPGGIGGGGGGCSSGGGSPYYGSDAAPTSPWENSDDQEGYTMWGANNGFFRSSSGAGGEQAFSNSQQHYSGASAFRTTQQQGKAAAACASDFADGVAGGVKRGGSFGDIGGGRKVTKNGVANCRQDEQEIGVRSSYRLF
ncbi:hypothetical protein HK100_003791 [Physocladia obscura]|uniref:Uncharacterized protein n=1 Tax=Physocladia obscura TaxID=109957 RepID=A0AAD5SZM9_9FUNG|nr:hypothetical protein HK100_003791 [Physocladia obscura]